MKDLERLVDMLSGLEDMSLEDIQRTNYCNKDNINDLGCVTIKCSELLEACGIAISGLLMLNLEGVDHYVPAVLVDETFDELSKNAKMFIIGHELGYYEYHVEKIVNPDYLRNIEDECQADKYSAELIGIENALKGLEELKEKMIEISFGLNIYGVQEVEQRIETLRNENTVLA